MKRALAILLGAAVLAAGVLAVVVLSKAPDEAPSATASLDGAGVAVRLRSTPVTAAWRIHAVAEPESREAPIIAIVIDDLGPDAAGSARAVALPAPVTLAWLSYADDLPRRTTLARAAGHELLIHLPMEPIDGKENPGPGALRVDADPAVNRQRLRDALARFEFYVGVNNHMGSRFTSDAAQMRPILEELKARGLLFFDSRTSENSVGFEIARSLGLARVNRDVFLDTDVTPAAIATQLRALEAIAKRRGYAVAIGHPHAATLDALSQWIPQARSRGFVLVPISAIARRVLLENGELEVGG